MARSLGWSALFFALVGEIASIIDQRNIFIPRYFIALNPYALMMFALGFETLVAKIRDAKLKNLAYGIPVSFCMFFGGAYEYAKPAWRKLASIAAEKEVKLVYTTRSRSIAMPYYYIRGIEVRQFTYSDEFVDELAEALQEKKPIMVLDDLYSRETYLKYLLLDLQNERIITESFEISENRAEPLFGLVLYGIRN